MLKWLLTGGLLPPFLMAVGLFFLFYLRGCPFRCPKRMLRALRTPTKEGEISPFRALMQALAGTLGVGNLVGVAGAITLGGAGAILWMWISAIFTMILKYAEILLAVKHRRVGRDGFFGGAVYYIRDAFLGRRLDRLGIVLPSAFAVLMMIDALSMGCMIQVDAVSDAFLGIWEIPPWITGILLCVLTLPLLFRGSRGISALTEYLVPIMTGGYVLLSLAVLICRRDTVADAFLGIFEKAFSTESAVGGVGGFLTSRALRTGTMRGLLSNEGGSGTAPTAHAEASAASPASQGLWGILEVFVDTIVLCSMSALVILVGGEALLSSGYDGIMLTIHAYSSVLGLPSESFFAIAVFCFGYATLLCWGAYGLESLRFLTPRKRWRWLYLLLFGISILWGAISPPAGIWEVADFCIALLTSINLVVLLLLRSEIREETLNFRQSGG